MDNEGDDNPNNPLNAECQVLPLQATPSQLIWDCVEIGSSSVKKLKLENTSQNPLLVKITSNSTQFMLFKGQDDNDLQSTLEVSLQPLEPHMVRVNFCPSAKGAYTGELVFTSTEVQLEVNLKQLSMYGYGGYADVYFYYENTSSSEIVNDRIELELGDLSDNLSVVKNGIVFENDGDLSAFVFISFEARSGPFPVSVHLQDEKFVIRPEEEKMSFVEYRPKQEDITYFEESTATVFELGVLRIHTGAEALRGRMRRMANKAADDGYVVDRVWKELASVFQNEDISDDLDNFNEDPSEIEQLSEEVVVHELPVRLKYESDNEE